MTLQRSNELLQSAKDAIQSHEVALESMKSRLAAIDNSKAESAAADALKLVEQVEKPTHKIASVLLVALIVLLCELHLFNAPSQLSRWQKCCGVEVSDPGMLAPKPSSRHDACRSRRSHR